MERGQKYSLGGEGVVVVVMGLGGGGYSLKAVARRG